MTRQAIHIIGAGLAGSEAAWQIAEAGIPAIIHEMKPQKFSAAHKNPNCAELVCSNSLRSDDLNITPSACCMKKCDAAVP